MSLVTAVTTKWHKFRLFLIKYAPREMGKGALAATGSVLLSGSAAIGLDLASPIIDSGQVLVGIFVDPAYPDQRTTTAQTPGTVASDPKKAKCLTEANTTLYKEFPFPGLTIKQTEIWHIKTSKERVNGKLTNTEGSELGDIRGFQKPKGRNEPMDTMTTSFIGEVGRGTYYLEKYYVNGVPTVQWWRGKQSYYDCHRQLVVSCPYVLGPRSVEKAMRQDDWLLNRCMVEVMPTSNGLLYNQRQLDLINEPVKK